MTLLDVAAIVLCILYALSLALSFLPGKRPEWKGYHEIDGLALREVMKERKR